jgi:hypothetical protein
MNMRLQQLESAAGISVDTTRQETLSAPVKPSYIPVAPVVKQTQVKQAKQPAPITTVKPKSKAQEKADFDAAFAQPVRRIKIVGKPTVLDSPCSE